MPEKDTGSTELLESPAELAKKIKKLEEQLAKKDADIADLKERNGKQANALMELSDRIDKMESGSETPKEIKKSAETSDIEASLEAKFGEHTFSRGDIVTYTSSKGSEGKYYVLCNSYDDPPGLVLQSVERDDLVFSISGDTDSGRIKPTESSQPSETGTPEPPLPGEQTSPGSGEGPGSGTEKPAPIPDLEKIPELGESEAAYQQKWAELEIAIGKYAVAKVDREKLIAGGAKAEFDIQEGTLQEAFGQWAESLGDLLYEKNKILFEYREQAGVNKAAWQSELTKLEAMWALAPGDRPADLAEQITNAKDQITALEAYIVDNKERIDLLNAQKNEVINNKLLQIQQQVEQKMTEEREKRHPKLSKLTGWLKKHPKARMAAGVVLAGVGFVGAMTGNVPMAVGAMAGRTALRGIGGYNAVRGGADWLAKRRFDKAEVETIEDYLRESKKESITRSRSKKGGLAVGAGLAAIPFVANWIEQIKVVDQAPKPNPPGGPTISPENQEAFARYLGVTSKSPEGAANFNSMFGATPEQLAGIKGSISLEHLTDPNWMQQAGITSEAARNQFNYLLGQASTSPEATQQFIDNLPATLNQLRG